jgi:hypothetical protein
VFGKITHFSKHATDYRKNETALLPERGITYGCGDIGDEVALSGSRWMTVTPYWSMPE